MRENLISFIIHIFIGVYMIGVGVYQMRKHDPVHFDSKEKPLRHNEVTDMKSYNNKHGLMWIIFGIIFILFEILGRLMGYSSYFFGIVMLTAITGTIIAIKYHHKLKNEYIKK